MPTLKFMPEAAVLLRTLTEQGFKGESGEAWVTRLDRVEERQGERTPLEPEFRAQVRLVLSRAEIRIVLGLDGQGCTPAGAILGLAYRHGRGRLQAQVMVREPLDEGDLEEPRALARDLLEAVSDVRSHLGLVELTLFHRWALDRGFRLHPEHLRFPVEHLLEAVS